jgi:hypothetical protein
MIKENIEELYELILQDDEDGVFANSLVLNPAIGRDFIYMSKEVQFAEVSDEKRLVAGPLLIPNKKILRIDGEGKRYSVFFTPETIEKVARKFMKNKYGDEVTLEHGGKTSGVYLTESWIVEQSAKDKSNIYGFTLPRGTWFGVYKIDNDAVWQKVKDGTFRAYSIEGLFEHRKSNLKLSLEKDIEELTEDEVEVLLSQIKSLILEENRVELESYNDYPESASNNAKRALEWADKNGWGDCLESTGKARANQLANRENITRDTIARMASFKRHQQYKDVPYSEGCGGLAWDAWGGTSGVEWAINKLKEIDLEAQPSITSTYPGQIAKKKEDDK